MLQRESVPTVFLVLSLVALVVLVGRLVLPWATPVGWACILAAVFHPAYRLTLRAMPRYPGVAAGLLTVAVFTLAVVPALLLTGVVAREAITAYQGVAAFVAENRVRVLDDVSHHWMIEPIWEWTRERLAGGEVNPTTLALSGLRWLSEFAATNAAQVARNVLGFLVGMAVLVFTLFFAFRDGAGFLAYLEESLPMAPSDRRRVFGRLQRTLLAVVQGLAATALIQAVLMGVALWALGVPFVLLLSVTTFGLAFIPVAGSALVWLPVALGLYAAGDWVPATALLLWGVVVVSSVDNVLRPLMIGGQARLPTPLLFFGIMGGLQVFGILGLFAGPALIAALLAVVSIYRERLLELPSAAEDA